MRKSFFHWFILFTCAQLLCAGPVWAKDENPLQGAFEPEIFHLDKKQSTELRLKIISSVAYEKAHLTLKVPEGLALLKGAMTRDIGPFEPGKPLVFTWKVIVLEKKPLVVDAVVKADTIPGVIVQQVFVAQFNPAPKKEDPVRTDPSGKKVRTRKVKTLPPFKRPKKPENIEWKGKPK